MYVVLRQNLTFQIRPKTKCMYSSTKNLTFQVAQKTIVPPPKPYSHKTLESKTYVLLRQSPTCQITQNTPVRQSLTCQITQNTPVRQNLTFEVTQYSSTKTLLVKQHRIPLRQSLTVQITQPTKLCTPPPKTALLVK